MQAIRNEALTMPVLPLNPLPSEGFRVLPDGIGAASFDGSRGHRETSRVGGDESKEEGEGDDESGELHG